MSSLLLVPERQWYLPTMPSSVRNNQTLFLLGESTGGTGFKFDRKGLASKLTVIGETTVVGAGTWTFTVTVYTDGLAAGNKVFELTFSSTIASVFSSTDTTPDGGGPGAGYGTGTDWFMTATSTLGGFTSVSVAFNVVLEGYHVA
jgi:hypothetical protein